MSTYFMLLVNVEWHDLIQKFFALL